MKNLFYFVAIFMLFSCGQDAPLKQEIKISGYAQGTTYSVLYVTEDGVNHQRSIDSLLIEIDNTMSTYQKKSLISKWNNSEAGLLLDDNHFINVFNISKKVFKESGGLFDPTIAPVVNAWGFGFENYKEVDSVLIDSLLSFVNFQKLRIEFDTKLSKLNKSVRLDFNAVAQGYTVDVLGELLEKRGINNYLVEVGGELRAKGNNIKDTLWRVGIDKPLPNLKEREIEAIVSLDNLSLATSGNYRKFYEKDGKKYSHTINPKTGYPVEHNLLSATVITNECAYADAYATAFMVMGLEKSKAFLETHKDLMALLIFSDENGDLQTFTTNNLTKYIELNPNKN